ncbi:hypothetical protein DFR52_104290 [Hoeflea marina]|uniref:Ferredoxin n=1 Tax=Hoeflea marina TaxID=274592 RepID=A0A317PK89_9HYPH|nr:4Fe-4S dicluster domain-containing protein [Hoeflea marina]PWV98999.1 hypothetical protein DFR52_104290 [Hoeflea marina]
MDEAGLIAGVAAALDFSGLAPRGWLRPAPDLAPRLADGEAAAAICLVGHAGGAFWPVFAAWHADHPGIADPLDRWSEAVIGPVADLVGGSAVFPSDRPWQPFQQWAMAAEGLTPSPLGMLIHPVYGLWHGYRGAILFGMDRLAVERENRAAQGSEATAWIASAAMAESAHPCERCVGKPCLGACPVGAFVAGGFDVAGCRTYLASEAGTRGCMQTGCLARAACPVGPGYRYGEAQLRFHMAAFR